MRDPKYVLHLFILSNDDNVKKLYQEKVTSHNDKINKSQFPDSGFDLLMPFINFIHFEKNNISDITYKLPQGVKCAMYNVKEDHYVGYYLYPRSSIIRTSLRLANSVGIIDAGYRGEIIAVVDNIDKSRDLKAVIGEYARQNERLFQICAPDLSAFYVKIVEIEEELGITERGSGGFGSTGL